MTVKVDGMDVITGIAHSNAVTLALLQMKRGGDHFVGHGESDSIDSPAVEAFFGGVVFGEGHLKGHIGGSGGGAGFCETRIVPFEGRWRDPLGFAGAAGVLDDNAHAVAAIIVVEIAQDPDAGMIHFHDGRNAFGSTEP